MLGVGGDGGYLTTAQCPKGQAAVGYTAAPSCSGLNQLQVHSTDLFCASICTAQLCLQTSASHEQECDFTIGGVCPSARSLN